MSPLLSILLIAAASPVEFNPIRADWVDLRRTLIPGENDISPLSKSLRVPPTNLLQPAGFREVIAIDQLPGKRVRIDGALYAVFDESEYVDWKGESIAVLPSSTVFYIGSPMSLVPPAKPAPATKTETTNGKSSLPRAGFGVVAPVSSLTSTGRATVVAGKHRVAKLPRFVADKAYRTKRLARLLRARGVNLLSTTAPMNNPDQTP